MNSNGEKRVLIDRPEGKKERRENENEGYRSDPCV